MTGVQTCALPIFKKMILQLMYDLFHLESYVISETYGGEKFGEGVYYRLLYASEQEEEKWEIFLVFEEKLLLNTVGKVMGIRTNKLDSMLMNAARYMARQFIGCIREHLPDMNGYVLKEENLLTYEQFQRAFENERLQVSLLIDTGEGYFAYCMSSRRHLLKKADAEPLNTANAMTEVTKYLTIRKGRLQPKILVVDDSATLRMGIKKLLSKDYDVALAQSGAAALRCIILDKPDLVLLDYEMPVCNGKQVLEMIRSEETLADVPVIFLTGRTDLETVKKLIALKPEGYLAKYLKPEEIKQKIDAYFQKKTTSQ